MQPITGPAADALASLSIGQIAFITNLPKAELHAHLNGSIPIATLRELAQEYASQVEQPVASDLVVMGLGRLQDGVELEEINDFFHLFPAIYALTSTPGALSRATRAVLQEFLDGHSPQCAYLELRTTPRQTHTMTRTEYLQVVLDEIEMYPSEKASLIVSLDRRMVDEVAEACVNDAIALRRSGRRIVGLDLCGDPTVGNVEILTKHFRTAKMAGLGVTLHIAETCVNSPAETHYLLSLHPTRLGHATFLDDAAKETVLKKKMCIEICLTSNLLCKTVQDLKDHHIRYYLRADHPIVICTDDILPFRTSLLGEYALLMAQPPLGLGLSQDEISRIAQMSMECRFPR